MVFLSGPKGVLTWINISSTFHFPLRFHSKYFRLSRRKILSKSEIISDNSNWAHFRLVQIVILIGQSGDDVIIVEEDEEWETSHERKELPKERSRATKKEEEKGTILIQSQNSQQIPSTQKKIQMKLNWEIMRDRLSELVSVSYNS